MAFISLRISVPEKNLIKMMQFDPNSLVHHVCATVREKISESDELDKAYNDYGLFFADESTKKGVWLESERNLNYYILRNGDLLEFKKKTRTLRVRMLDGTLKTMLVDDSHSVAMLMVVICTKIGITNHDEYSLVRESIEEDYAENKKDSFGTLTLRKKNSDKLDKFSKMDQLRKKLKTDDEVNWIDPAKTLREQGITEAETVLLRRKFFFSDQNIDSRDPVQLSLLYVQARDAIIDGTHPIVLEQACIFAGIQCQIQFGDHKEDKHKPGFLELKEFLPQSYYKVKGVEKKIFMEHKKHIGLTELESKVLYTKTARDLKTYGVTFFLVKEKLRGKNKLVPRLLGVTKDSVLRLDEKTKEILKTWPLTTVRRWGASPNTFTLDFGDYSDQYYSVQTTEAEQILQLISGYIDIILKKQKSKDHFGIEGNEGSSMIEDSISPLRATIMQHELNKIDKKNADSVSVAIPAVMRMSQDGSKPYERNCLSGTQFTTASEQIKVFHSPAKISVSEVTSIFLHPKRALASTITTGQEIIKLTKSELSKKEFFPEVGNDNASLKWIEKNIDTHKENISSQIAAMNAATAQVITLTSTDSENIDHTAIGAAITTITSNLPEMAKGVKILAALLNDDSAGDKLLEAARKLCLAFADLLKATKLDTKEPKQCILNAASQVGEASHHILATVKNNDSPHDDLPEVLLALAKMVANATAALVLKAKNVATTIHDSDSQNKVITAATQCALATSQLVACVKVVGPTLYSISCQSQLIIAVREVTKSVEELVEICNSECANETSLKNLSGCATDVTEALNKLLMHIKSLNRNESSKYFLQEQFADTIFSATNELFTKKPCNKDNIIQQTKIVGQATAQLIQNIKFDANKQSNTEQQQALLAAAKALADATSKMVEAARQCAISPEDSKTQNNLREALEELRSATVIATKPSLKYNLLEKLQEYTKQAISSAAQCSAASSAINMYNVNTVTQNELNEKCKLMMHHIPRLISEMKKAYSEYENVCYQLNFINAVDTFLVSCTHVSKCVKATLPTIIDQASALHLNNSMMQLNTACSDLKLILSRMKDIYTGLEFDAVEELLKSLQCEVQELFHAVEMNSVKPLPGETAQSTLLEFGLVSKNIEFVIIQLLSARSQNNETYLKSSLREFLNNIKDLIFIVRGVISTNTDKTIQMIFLNHAEIIIKQSLQLVQKLKYYCDTHEVRDIEDMDSIFQDITNSLESCISYLPGQREVKKAIESMNNDIQKFSSNDSLTSCEPYEHVLSDLNSAAAYFSEVSSRIVSAAGSSTELADASSEYANAFGNLVQSSKDISKYSSPAVKKNILHSLQSVCKNSISLLSLSKSLAIDQQLPNAKSQLSSSSKIVTESLNQLVNECLLPSLPSNSCQIECDNSIRNIKSTFPVLNNPNGPLSDTSYFECLDVIMEKSKSLGDGMTGIANHAKTMDHNNFTKSIKEVSESVCGLIHAAAQAAYLAGISDVSSSSGKPGLIDSSHFFRAASTIEFQCQLFENPFLTQEQILSAATSIAKFTSALCNSCRLASSKTKNPIAKRHFVQSARNIANSTAALVKEIKLFNDKPSEENRLKCLELTKPLVSSIKNLCTFIRSSDFISHPPFLSETAKCSQEPIISAAISILNSSCAMISSAKNLVLDPKDPPSWQLLANRSRNVSDSIKALVASIRDKAPGQKECDASIVSLNSYLRDIDKANVNINSEKPTQSSTIESLIFRIKSSSCEIHEKLNGLCNAAKCEAENIGRSTTQITLFCESLLVGSIGLASCLMEEGHKILLLDDTKNFLESVLQVMCITKECGGNPKAENLHIDLDKSIHASHQSLYNLEKTIETVCLSNGIVVGLIEDIMEAMRALEDLELIEIEQSDSKIAYNMKINGILKEVLRIINIIAVKPTEELSNTCFVAASLSHNYCQLANLCKKLLSSSADNLLISKLLNMINELGNNTIDLIRIIGDQCITNNVCVQQEISESCQIICNKVTQILQLPIISSRGTQACINAASTVSGIIGDLDTTIMFATTGTLHPENENEKFADHRESILKTAKALVEDTKTLVAGAASSQEQLAVAAQNAVSTILHLAEVVKYGAASLGSRNTEAQVMLINAVRDVVAALGDLIHATKSASGKLISDPCMSYLKDSAKVMVTNVTSLLKTVKAIEDEHARGTRALESAIEAIIQEINYPSNAKVPSSRIITSEDLFRCTRMITDSTSKIVAAGISCKQDDIIAAANTGRRMINEMFDICKNSSTLQNQEFIITATNNIATDYKKLLELVLEISTNSPDSKVLLLPLSKRISENISDIINVAESMQGNDSNCTNALCDIAESELLGAAASIDTAAKKLARLQPRKALEEAKEMTNFDEIILNAARTTAAATSALIKAASTAQKELIVTGKVSKISLSSSDDGQWSEGLISASKMVAAATHSLVESANTLVQGISSEEKLISSAKQVASSTAQLLVACKVKSDADSESTKQLQAAGNAVKRATDNLVRAAQQSIQHEEERSLILNRRIVGGIAQEIDARSEVLRIERELDEARSRLTAIRQAKYKNRNEIVSNDSTEFGADLDTSSEDVTDIIQNNKK